MKSSLKTKFADSGGRRYGTRPDYWDKAALETWQAGHSEERRQDDARLLSRLYEAAETVPALRETLDWARATGLEFVVDRNLRNDGPVMHAGYYMPGSGVVAIAAWCFADGDLTQAIATAVHEARHAWQEAEKLAPNISPNFTDYALRLSAVEADATAHERLAVRQYQDARAGVTGPGMDVKKEMWGYFKEWYGTQGDIYVGFAESAFAENYGLSVAAAGAGTSQPSYAGIPFEFMPPPTDAIAFPGFDIARPEQFRRLAKTYSGANYFDAADKDFMQREVLSPGRAAAHFGTDAPAPLALQIRRCELRQKFAGRKVRCPGM